MSVRHYSGSLYIGLLLIVLGAIFLIENIHTPFPPMRLIERYWPLVFVFIGVKRIFDYFLWVDTSLPNDPPRAKE